MTEPRLIAIHWLLDVIERGKSVNQLLSEQKLNLAPQDQALTKQLLFGCLRYYHQLKTIADHLLNKPFKAKDQDLLLIIVLGLYQLKYLSTPDHAAISESVELSRKINKSWAAGLINGVLRRFQRESEKIQQELKKSLQFQYSHPGWIVKKISSDWNDSANDILNANNLHAPMIIRVNTLRQTREEYLALLSENKIVAKAHAIAPDAIELEKAVDVYQLPGFTEGLVTIQDAAPQLAVELLDLKPEQNVLDGCAAPGGKTTHLLQRENSIHLTAVEMSASRAEKIQQTLQRMQLTANVKISDICDRQSWWDGELFDRILLDVPCSASGVIRRNPDIKVHRKVTDIQPLIEIQKSILDTAWQLLKPNGILVYATCSIFKIENEEQIKQFKSRHLTSNIDMPESIEKYLPKHAEIGYQIFPNEFAMDGFYLCGLRKPA